MPHPTGKVLTRTQLIAKADTICARRNTKLAALSISSQREIVGILPVVIAYDNRESRELGKLVPPPSLMHDWEQIVSLANHYSEEIEQVERYAAVQNNSVASSFTRASAATHNRLIAIARHAGFKDCSEVG